jgi:thioredoxin-like negative regulator of GroEL
LKDSVSNILREVKSAMQQDNFGDALSLLEQMLKIFPENKTALLYKAEIGIQTVINRLPKLH